MAGLPVFALLFCEWKIVPEFAGVGGGEGHTGECPQVGFKRREAPAVSEFSFELGAGQ